MSDKNEVLKTREVFAYACTAAVGLGGIMVNSFLSGYWTDVVGISIGVVGVIMLIARIFDGFSDIVMGLIIDKTHTKYGKAKPWFLVGTVGSMVCSTFIFATPNLGMTGKIIYAAIMYLMINAVFATMSGVAAPTLINLMTTDTNTRFKMGSWYFSMMFFVSMLMGYGLNVIVALGGDQPSYFKFALGCNIIGAVLMVFIWFNIQEHHGQEAIESKEKVSVGEFLATIFSNKYFLLVTGMYFTTNISTGVAGGAMYYYVMYVLQNPLAFGILSTASYGACIVGTLFAPMLGKKVGITRLVLICNFITAGAYILILFNPSNLIYVVVLMTIGALANGPACSVLAPYNAMAADYGEYTTGVARPAVYSAGTSVGTKLGVGLGGVMFSFILAVAGYNGMAEVQTSLALTSMTWSYILVPAIVMLVINLLTVPFLKLEKEYDAIGAELAKRHADSEA